MCRGSEGNVAGLVRLQRRVGQEVAASLLTVLAFAHHHHPTGVALRGRTALAKGPGSVPHARDLRAGREERTAVNAVRPGSPLGRRPSPLCLVDRRP
jgi:hypothetical protein